MTNPKKVAPKDLSFDEVGDVVDQVVGALTLLLDRLGWLIPDQYEDVLQKLLAFLRQIQAWLG